MKGGFQERKLIEVKSSASLEAPMIWQAERNYPACFRLNRVNHKKERGVCQGILGNRFQDSREITKTSLKNAQINMGHNMLLTS
jgi:sRNA-binding protein